jgi:NADH dehydrogenase FAD-containing subunit
MAHVRRSPRKLTTGRSRPRVVIVGGNFAGIAAAQHLDGRYAVTVIDRSPWFEWLPNIHELLSGVKRPADLRLPRARLVRRAGHRFVRAEVTRVDVEAGAVVTSTGRRFPFDACIVAVGGVDETFGVPGAERHAMSFKGVDDCAAIGRRLEQLTRRPGKAYVVIVGGGFEGIEALGEILRRYVDRKGLTVSLVEAGPRLMPSSPASIDRAVRRHCARRDVRFLTGTRVTKVTPTRVHVSGAKPLRSDLTIWTGGVKAPPLLLASGLADRAGQWAPVTQALRSKRHRNVFVIGDAAGLPQPLGKQAYYALQMGMCAAENVERALAGRRLRDFRPAATGMLVAFGEIDTFLIAGRAVIASPALAAAKEAVFQVTMAQLDPPLAGDALRGAARRFVGTARRRLLSP